MIPRITPEKENNKNELEIPPNPEKNISKYAPISSEMKSNDLKKEEMEILDKNDVNESKKQVEQEELFVTADQGLEGPLKKEVEPKKMEGNNESKISLEKNEISEIKKIETKEILVLSNDKGDEKEKMEEEIENKIKGMFKKEVHFF
jgi:hypothetical protein